MYHLQHLSTGLVEHLNRFIANILILLKHLAGIGVEHPHAAVQGILLFYNCKINTFCHILKKCIQKQPFLAADMFAEL